MNSVKVRLHGIDAPESKQAFGTRVKQELSELAFGKGARVEIVEKDRYGRIVGRVFVGTLDVNREMVRRGFAWWYHSYAKKPLDLETAKAGARNVQCGLWAAKASIPPWEFQGDGIKAKSPGAAGTL